MADYSMPQNIENYFMISAANGKSGHNPFIVQSAAITLNFERNSTKAKQDSLRKIVLSKFLLIMMTS